jgi:hypothetical protein
LTGITWRTHTHTHTHTRNRPHLFGPRNKPRRVTARTALRYACEWLANHRSPSLGAHTLTRFKRLNRCYCIGSSEAPHWGVWVHKADGPESFPEAETSTDNGSGNPTRLSSTLVDTRQENADDSSTQPGRDGANNAIPSSPAPGCHVPGACPTRPRQL